MGQATLSLRTRRNLELFFQNLKERQEKNLEKWLAKHVVGSHLRRLGVLKTTVGGGSMYFSIPLFFILHLIFIEIILQRIITPLLGLTKLPTKNYIILDRHQTSGLSGFDKFNCVFCGYANGTSVLLNEKISQLMTYEKPSGFSDRIKMGVAVLLIALFFPIFLILELSGVDILYGILISRPLSMHRTTTKEVGIHIDRQEFNASQWGWASYLIKYQKIANIRLISALEQIESSWCPLQHNKNENNIKYPDHHENFFNGDQLEEMREKLLADGTVSDKKPTRKIKTLVYPIES